MTASRYVLSLSCPDGPHVVAQQAFYGLTNDRISWLRVMCAGFQPMDEADAPS